MIKTVFFGNSKYVIPVLEVLDPVLIVTTEKNASDPVITYARNLNIPYLSVKNLSDHLVKDKLINTKTKAAVLADFGLLVPSEILTLYPKGIINIHPSLLPKYRGPTPVQSAILDGNINTGISLIKLDKELDHGPIIAQKRIFLNGQDTSETAYFKLFSEGARLLSESFEKYIQGIIKPYAQNHLEATFTEKLTRESGFFDILNPPKPEVLNKMIKAYYPWPGAWTKIKINGKVKIIKFLPENKLQVEGKKPVTLDDFYNGYPELKDTINLLLNTSNYIMTAEETTFTASAD